jgi:sugar phosphate isomerase/epimerase
MAIWFSSGAFHSHNVGGVLAEASVLGIEGIELGSGLRCSSQEMLSLRTAVKKHNKRFLVHNYFPAPSNSFVLNIASLDEHNLHRSLEMVRCGLTIAADLNSPFYSVHAGFAAPLRAEDLGKPVEQAIHLTCNDIRREQAYLAMVKHVKHLAHFAERLGLSLLIENNVISPVFLAHLPINPLLLTESNEIIQFFKDLDCDNVGLLLDVAHAKVSANALNFDLNSFVEDVAPYVQCVHLSDNKGQQDTNDPFTSNSWFIPKLSQFKGSEFVIEAYKLSADVMISQLEILNDILP